METSRGGRDSRSAAAERGGRLHARHEFGSQAGQTAPWTCACARCGLDCKPAGEGIMLPRDKTERRRLLRTVRLDARSAEGAKQIEKMVNGGERSYKLHRRHRDVPQSFAGGPERSINALDHNPRDLSSLQRRRLPLTLLRDPSMLFIARLDLGEGLINLFLALDAQQVQVIYDYPG